MLSSFAAKISFGATCPTEKNLSLLQIETVPLDAER
jgi:hypothetical protein